MKRIILSLLLLFLFVSVAHAAPCGKKCAPKSCRCSVAAMKRAPSSLAEYARDGFALVAGFRWQTEKSHECPTPRRPNPPREIAVKDPFYIGAELDLPLTERTSAGLAWNRDFVASSEWQARVQLKFRPFR